MFILFQSVVNDAVQILSIKSVSIIGLLLAFIAYVIWQNSLLKKELTLKDAKIASIIAEHTKDIKEGNKTVLELVAKYHTFVEQLRSYRSEFTR